MSHRMIPSKHRALKPAAVFLCVCSLFAVDIRSAQNEQEDTTRRIWNKKFRESRSRVTHRSRTIRPSGKQSEGELIGVTIWRLREEASGGEQDKTIAERAMADTAFNEGDQLRISIEVPKEGDSYLYVIDREVYADGRTSDPYLIFPSQATPARGNVVSAGRLVYVPAQGDPIPYFTLHRSRKDQVRETLTLIVSPTPLKVHLGTPANPTRLERAKVDQWEKLWGGRVQRQDDPRRAGEQWTVAEKSAAEASRHLVQGDPLPQTIYLVRAKPGGPILLHVPLSIAR